MKQVFIQLKKERYFAVVLAVAVLVAIAIGNYTAPRFSAAEIHTYSLTETVKRTAFTTLSALEKKNVKTSPAKKNATIQEPSAYRDGIYYGIGSGFAGDIKVKVCIQKGKIKQISIVSSRDDASYLNKAKKLLSQIIKKQTTNVDAISGATYSSNGLIAAVRNALQKAAVSPKKTSQKTTVKRTTEKPSTTRKVIIPIENVNFQDGVYYGIGEGFKGEIHIKVIIQNGKIVLLETVSSADDEAYYQKATALFKMIVETQSTAVDAVSGATFSSQGILEAVTNALQKAKRNPEQTTAVSTTTESTTVPLNPSVQYHDGSYTAQAFCYPDETEDFEAYELQLQVDIQNGRIASVKNIQGIGNDYDSFNDWYLTRAANGTNKMKGVIAQIQERHTAEQVDAVSGATCSSHAIAQAVQVALEQAKKGNAP